jgi:folate/biopterin transporter
MKRSLKSFENAQKRVRSQDESDHPDECLLVQSLVQHDVLSTSEFKANRPLHDRDECNVENPVNVDSSEDGERLAVDSDASALAKRPYVLYHYYFCHGIQEELPSIALYLVLKNSFRVQPADYSLVLGLSWLPWVLKPVVGYLSDTFPIAGRRRTPYVVIGVVLNQLGSLLLSEYDLIGSKRSYLLIMMFNAVAEVVSETAVDSLLAEMARREPDDQIGRLQSTIWTFDAAGTVVGSIIPIILFGFDLSPRVVLLISASVVALQALVVPFLPESRSTEQPSAPRVALRGVLRKCLDSHLALVKAVTFAFLLSSTPTSGDAFEYFQTDVLQFSPTFLSWMTVIQTFANWVAAGAFTTHMRSWNVRSVFRIAILMTASVSLFNLVIANRWNVVLGIPDKIFVAGGTVVQGLAGEIAFMPVAVLAARLAPAGREGTVYAVVMAVVNVAWACSELISGLLSRWMGIADGSYANMPPLLLAVAAAALAPLLCLRLVPEIPRADASGRDHHVISQTDESVSLTCPMEDRFSEPSTHQESLEEGAEHHDAIQPSCAVARC